MVSIFNDITATEIRVSWVSATAGYVSGYKFEVDNEQVTFPGSDIDTTDRDLYRALGMAVRKTPEFTDAKRESKSNHLTVTNGNFPGVYSVFNPLNSSVYHVIIHPNKTFCECADHQYRNIQCKHIKAVKKHIEKALEPKLKLRSWNIGKLPSVGKIKAISESQITDEMISNARASLGI
ncbi:SWIM zinc finger family protein [Planktothrix tepida]|uniref:SWIM zinc finger family protein n=1 Tax=Planktothrix tepida TaxID=1678309 RepID=UPI000932123F|nr:SWIM zinc finger family protein [Planktothrix tepida]